MENSLVNSGNSLVPKNAARGIINQIKAGDINPLEAHIALKKFAKIADIVGKSEEIREAVNREASLHARDNVEFEAYGAKAKHCATSTKYDYSRCGHEELDEWLEIAQTAKDKIKAITDELKKIAPGKEEEILIKRLPKITYERVGELINVTAPTKSQGFGVKVTC